MCRVCRAHVWHDVSCCDLIPVSFGGQALTVTHHTWVLPAQTEEGTGGRSAEPRPSVTCSPAAGTQQQSPEGESLLARLLSLLPFSSLFASSLPLRPPQSLSSPPPVAGPPPGSSHGPTCAPLKVATFNIWYTHARPQAAATADHARTHATPRCVPTNHHPCPQQFSPIHTTHTTRHTHSRHPPPHVFLTPLRAIHTTHRFLVLSWLPACLPPAIGISMSRGRNGSR